MKGQNWVVYWGRRRKYVKRNEGAWLATRKKNIVLGPVPCIVTYGRIVIKFRRYKERNYKNVDLLQKMY